MSTSDNSMKLTRWDNPTDKFNYQQLAENFRIIAEHNHDPEGAGGVQIGNGGIANGAIDNGKLSIDAVNTDNILTGAVTEGKIDSGFVSKAVPSYLGTSPLPSSPIDGQEVYYGADEANNKIWHLRYRGDASNWEFIGGSHLTVYDTTDRTSGSINHTTQSSNWFRVWTTGSPFPKISVPLPGTYIVDINSILGYPATGLTGTIGVAAELTGTQTGNGTPITDSPGYTAWLPQSQPLDYQTIRTRFIYTVPTNTPSANRYIQSLYRLSATADTPMKFYSSIMTLTPVGALSNWTV